MTALCNEGIRFYPGIPMTDTRSSIRPKVVNTGVDSLAPLKRRLPANRLYIAWDAVRVLGPYGATPKHLCIETGRVFVRLSLLSLQ